MKTIDIYANGPIMNFETIEDLKTNEKVRKTLFDEHGFLKTFYIFEDANKRNPLNNRFRVGLFNNGKWASIETDTLDEMLSALTDFKVQIKVQDKERVLDKIPCGLVYDAEEDVEREDGQIKQIKIDFIPAAG